MPSSWGDFHCCGEHLSGAAGGCRGGLLGGSDFRLSGSGASARLSLGLKWQASLGTRSPPGGRAESQRASTGGREASDSDSLPPVWLAQERPGAVGWIMTRTAGPAEPPLAAHRAGAVPGADSFRPPSVGPQANFQDADQAQAPTYAVASPTAGLAGDGPQARAFQAT